MVPLCDSAPMSREDLRIHKKSKSEYTSTGCEETQKKSPLQSEHSFVSIARINLRDAKTEPSVSPVRLRLKSDAKELNVEGSVDDTLTHPPDSSQNTVKVNYDNLRQVRPSDINNSNLIFIEL